MSKLFAQAEGWAAPLTQFGGLGVILFWFMFRSDSKMNDLRESMDTLSRAHLLSVIANREASSAVREQAETVMKELEERRNKRRR